jgi:hypothetical protein
MLAIWRTRACSASPPDRGDALHQVNPSSPARSGIAPYRWPLPLGRDESRRSGSDPSRRLRKDEQSGVHCRSSITNTSQQREAAYPGREQRQEWRGNGQKTLGEAPRRGTDAENIQDRCSGPAGRRSHCARRSLARRVPGSAGAVRRWRRRTAQPARVLEAGFRTARCSVGTGRCSRPPHATACISSVS